MSRVRGEPVVMQIPPSQVVYTKENLSRLAKHRARALFQTVEHQYLDGSRQFISAALKLSALMVPPKSRRPVCGAKTRKGTPCQSRACEFSCRCRLHGGLSTGPKTEAGRAAIVESNRRRSVQNSGQKRTAQKGIQIS